VAKTKASTAPNDGHDDYRSDPRDALPEPKVLIAHNAGDSGNVEVNQPHHEENEHANQRLHYRTRHYPRHRISLPYPRRRMRRRMQC
jgi:hypothetical protein